MNANAPRSCAPSIYTCTEAKNPPSTVWETGCTRSVSGPSVGDGVGVTVRVCVLEGVGVIVRVGVSVAVGHPVVGHGVGVSVSVGVSVIVGVRVIVGVSVIVGVGGSNTTAEPSTVVGAVISMPLIPPSVTFCSDSALVPAAFPCNVMLASTPAPTGPAGEEPSVSQTNVSEPGDETGAVQATVRPVLPRNGPTMMPL